MVKTVKILKWFSIVTDHCSNTIHKIIKVLIGIQASAQQNTRCRFTIYTYFILKYILNALLGITLIFNINVYIVCVIILQ